MLSKEERKAIAERMSEEFDFTENYEVYEALIGKEITDDTKVSYLFRYWQVTI